MKIYVVICADCEGGYIDDDCVFTTKEAAEAKSELLMDENPQFIFTVNEIEVPVSGIESPVSENTTAEAISELADSVNLMSGAFADIAESMREFVKCSCTANANGFTPCNPTLIIKH